MANKLSGKVAPKAAKQKPVPVKIVDSGPTTSPAYDKQERNWRAESDLRTISEANQIMRDKSRMSAVKQVAKEQMKTLSSVCSPSKRK